MDAPTPLPAKDQDPDSLKISARKLKKRELDRKAQRLARERTKNRIQELELLVEQLKADSNNPEISNLTATLAKVTEQRNALQNVIKSIDQTIQGYALQHSPAVLRADNPRPRLNNDDDPSSPPPVQSKIEHFSGESSADAVAAAASAASAGCVGHGHHPPVAQLWQILPTDPLQPSIYTHVPVHTGAAPVPATAPAPGVAEGQLPPAGWHLSANSPPDYDQSSRSTSEEDIIVPQAEWPCECLQNGPKNYWRAVNQSLGRSTMLSPAQLAIEDFTSEDTPVRVILDGWDSVVKSGKMSLSWKKLREVDETCFSTCGDVERLGILRMMHLLMTYHGDPSQDRCERVPRCLWTRPSQALPHSYAIDFFIWPGVRERFVFGQHQYCTNTFWQLFQLNLRLNWPFDFKDCYNVDPDTGRYVFSPAFDSRLKDINTWRMGSDFFMHFPELAGDIPMAGGLSPVVPWTREERARYQAIAEREHGAPDRTAVHDLEVRSKATLHATSPASEYGQAGQGEPPETPGPWPSV